MRCLPRMALYLCVGVVVQMPLSTKGAEEAATGVDLFVEACRWQGLNPAMIRTGSVELELLVTTPQKSTKEIQEEVDQRSKELHEFIQMQEGEEIRSDLEGALKKLPDVVRARNTGARRSLIKVLFGGNDSTFGKRRCEVINYNPAAEGWDKPLLGLRRGLTKDGEDTALWDEGAFMATVSRTGILVPEFQAFGRMQGFASKVATMALLGGTDSELFEFQQSDIEAFKAGIVRMKIEGKADLYRSAGEEEYDEGAMAYVVENCLNGKVLQRYWIDASRGYICPLIQYYDQNGKLQREWKSSDYFLHEKSGLWFPERYKYTVNQENTGELREQREYTLDRNTLQINQEVSDEEFSVQIPVNASVLDTRSGKQVHYRAAEVVTLSLAKGGLELDSLRGLVLAEPAKPIAPRSRFSMVIIINVVMMALLGLVFFLRWWRKQRGSGLAPLLCFACLLGLGCSNAEDRESSSMHSLAIEPELIDFGRVRESNAPLELEFTAINRGDCSIEIIKVRSSCGCTVAELNKLVVPPHERISVPIKVDTRGRIGQFSNRILIDVSGQPNPIVVPIQGAIVQDIWHNGQAVRCSANDSNPTAETTFEVRTVDWPSVGFDWSALDEGISIRETSRSAKADETVIKFHLVVDVPADRYATTRQVTLKPLDERIKPLTIPVICYRPAFRRDATASSQVLRPDRISLGVIPRGEERRFRVFGDHELLKSLSVAASCEVPEGFEVELDAVDEADNSSLRVTVRVDESASTGLFGGQICLVSSDTREFLVAVSGVVRSGGSQ